MNVYHLIVVIGVLVASVSQLFLKNSSTSHHKSLFFEYFNPKVIIGYLLMGFVLMGDIYALGHGVKAKEVSILESLSYLFVPSLSYFFLKENLSARRIVAIFVILFGVCVFFI